ncbi:hypothetical protein AOQ84DRAFT_354085, partial [Glonium stellatum]
MPDNEKNKYYQSAKPIHKPEVQMFASISRIGKSKIAANGEVGTRSPVDGRNSHSGLRDLKTPTAVTDISSFHIGHTQTKVLASLIPTMIQSIKSTISTEALISRTAQHLFLTFLVDQDFYTH